MAYFSKLSFNLLMLLLLHGSIASSSKTTCQVIPRLMAMDSGSIIRSEAGVSEIWDPSYKLFQCAGVEVTRYTIQPNGLLLPSYYNFDVLYYIIQGKAMLGLIVPGCSQESDGKKNECQNIIRFQKGNVLAVSVGETIWSYNDGNEPLILIGIHRVTDPDGNRRRFHLAGSTKILNGFSLEFIRKAFNINNKLAMKLQKKDRRYRYVYVTGSGLNLSSSVTNQPCPRENQLEPNGLSNVVNESFCNINMRTTKISTPSRADLYIPKIGYFKTIDAHQLSILKSIQLSATYHLLLKDVMRLPHWENSYSIIYVVKGEGQIQVVDENGKNVFNDIVKEGQVLIVPRSFVMAELAKNKIFEYIIFKTNANPITSDLSGRNSVIYQLPSEIVTNAYNITEEEANKVKFERKETSLAKIMPKYT